MGFSKINMNLTETRGFIGSTQTAIKFIQHMLV